MLVAVGIGLGTAQDRTRLNISAAATVVLIGLQIVTLGPLIGHVSRIHPGVWSRLQGLFVSVAFVASCVFVWELVRAADLNGRRAKIVRSLLWFQVAMAGLHTVSALLWPVARLDDYMLRAGSPGFASHPGFWAFAGLWLASCIPFGGLLAFVGEHVSRSESRRAVGFFAGTFLWIIATAVVPVVAGVLVAVGTSIVVFATVQHTSGTARQAVFLRRFLSPRVTSLVAEGGLSEALAPRNGDVSALFADLRGFTAYSEGVPSHAVVDLLAEYYDAVGTAAAQYGATVTSLAGDGVFVLLGAPFEDPQHARNAVLLAEDILSDVGQVVSRWQTRMHALGVGIGIASGTVTVGVIAAATRQEYTAIGPPVNLAARLCSQAKANQILLDAETAQSAPVALTAVGEISIKGFTDAQQVFAVER
jgi:class 3 adenylate cyclase